MRHGPIFNIAIYGHETWPSAKGPEVAHIYTLFLAQEVVIEPIFALRAAVSEIRADFQNCHIWAWSLAIGQSFRSCTYSLFLPQGVKIELIFVLRAPVSEIRADFQNCNIWAWTWPLAKVPKVHIFCLSTPGGGGFKFTPEGWIWAYFRFIGCGFQGMDRFSKLPYLGMKHGH